MTKDRDLNALRWKVACLQSVVGTLITWMAQSANSPIRRDEAGRLLALLHAPYKGKKKRLVKGKQP